MQWTARKFASSGFSGSYGPACRPRFGVSTQCPRTSPSSLRPPERFRAPRRAPTSATTSATALHNDYAAIVSSPATAARRLRWRCSAPVWGIATEIAHGKEASRDWVGSPFPVVGGRDVGVPGVVRSLRADSEVSITGLPLGEERDSEQFHSTQGGLHPSTESSRVVTRSRPTCRAHMGPGDLGRPSRVQGSGVRRLLISVAFVT